MKLVSLILMTMFLVSCSKVPAGNVGIKVHLLGGSKGVNTEELGVGRYYIGFNEELYLFPTFQQNVVWTDDHREGSPEDESFRFQTKEGMVIGANVGLSYHLDPTKISAIFQKYRKGIDEITSVFLRNHVRNAFNEQASKLEVTTIYGIGKSQFLQSVMDQVSSEVSTIGIVIDKVYLIGSLELPQTVIDALNAKIQATQMAQQRRNEVEQTKAEAEKAIAKAEGEAQSILKVAKAQAKANRLISQSLTPNLVEYNKVDKWDGIMPKVNGGSSIISLDLDK